jgi:hypothetical protein
VSSFLLSHWFMSLVCLATLLFFAMLILLTGSIRTSARTYDITRLEKTADASLSVSALVIPASLGLAAWLHEKLASGSYTLALGAATFLFFVVLAFTIYIRFNLMLSPASTFKVDFQSDPHTNASIGYWFTTMMSGVTLGLVLLALAIATSWSAPLRAAADSTPAVKVTCIVTNPSQPAAAEPAQVPCSKRKSHSRKEKKK